MKESIENLENGHALTREIESAVGESAGAEAPRRKPGAGKEVERILQAVNKPLHLSVILAKLEAAGYTNTYQTMSGILQILCKKKKVFKKVAPATYALIGYKKTVKVRKAESTDPFSEKAAATMAGTEAI